MTTPVWASQITSVSLDGGYTLDMEMNMDVKERKKNTYSSLTFM